MIHSACDANGRMECSGQSINSEVNNSIVRNSSLKQARIKIKHYFRTCEVLQQPDIFINKVKRCLMSLPKVIPVTLRACTTVLSLGCFAGYYVSVVTITAASALIGVFTGLAVTLSERAPYTTRPVVEFALAFAHKTFGWLSAPYEWVSCDLNGALMPAFTATVLFLLETLIIPVKRIPINVYIKLCQGIYQFTKPFQTVTDFTEGLFKATKKMIQS